MKSAAKRLEKERGGLVDALIEFLNIAFNFLYTVAPLDIFICACKTPDNIPYYDIRRSQKKQDEQPVKNRIITNIKHISTSLYFHYSKEKPTVKNDVGKF
jgi:hypothetical protein